MSNKLSFYDVKEVSLVDEGANKEKFLLLKSKGGNMPGLLIDKIEQLEVDSELYKKLMEKFTLSEADKQLFEAFLKIHKAAEKNEVLNKALCELFKSDDPAPEQTKDKSEEITKALDEEKVKVEKALKEKEVILKENDALKKENKELKEKELKAFYVEKAKEFKKLSVKPEVFAEVLRKSKELLPESEYIELERILKSADASLEQGKDFASIFEAIGTNKEGGSAGKAELEKLVAEKMKADSKLTVEKARVLVMKERPEMVDVINEKGDK